MEDSSVTPDSSSDYSELSSLLPALEEEDDVSSYEVIPSLQTEDETPEDSLPELIIECDKKYSHDESEEFYDDLKKKMIKLYKKYILKIENVASPIDSDVQMYETNFNSGIVESIENEVEETASNSLMKTSHETRHSSSETYCLPTNESQGTVSNVNHGQSNEQEKYEESNNNNDSPEEVRAILDRDAEISNDNDSDDHDNAAGEGEESNNNGSPEYEIQSDDIEDNNSRSIENEVEETVSNSFIKTPGELLIESIMADWTSQCSLETNNLPKSASQETVNDLNCDSNEEKEEWNKNNASPEQEDRIMLDRDTEINDDDDTDDHDDVAGEGGESINNGSSENEIQSNDNESNVIRSNEVEKIAFRSLIITPDEQENDIDDTEAEEQEEGTVGECDYYGDDVEGVRRLYVLAKIPDLSPIPEVTEDGARASLRDSQERATIPSRGGRRKASRSHSRVDKRVGEVGVEEVSITGSAQDEGRASVSLAKTIDASKEVDSSQSTDMQTPEIMRHQRRSRLTDVIPAKRARRERSPDATPPSPESRIARVEQLDPDDFTMSEDEDPREVQRDVLHHGARNPDWSPIFEIRRYVSRRTTHEFQERATISSRESREKVSYSHAGAGVGEVGSEAVRTSGSTLDEEQASASLATPTDASEEGDASLSIDTRTPEMMRQRRHSSLTDVTPATFGKSGSLARFEDVHITSPSRESRTLHVEEIPDASTEADLLNENREDVTHMPSPNVVRDIAACYPIAGKIRKGIEKPIRIRFTPSGESSNVSHGPANSPIPELNIEVEGREKYTDDESEECYERLGRRMRKLYRKYILKEHVDSDDSAVQMYKDCISSLRL